MKTKNPLHRVGLLLAVCLLTLHAALLSVCAQGTAFTYQGRLTGGGQSANGLYDFQVSLYDAVSGGTLVAGPITRAATVVADGLFTLPLDFGDGVFTGGERWLLLQVRTNGAAAYVAMAPRQAITSSPYAITSGNVAGPIAAAQISGNVSTATLPTGGNWALNTTLTLDLGTLTVDPVNNRVGIGTTAPTAPFDIRAPHGVIRVESSMAGRGAVLELRGTNSPTYLGAINFNNLAGAYPGQIMYTASDALTFRTAGGTHMNLGASGQLDVWSGGSRGVYAESVSSGGVGVFGFNGPTGTASAVNAAGVVGESGEANGNGIIGQANSGSSAYGVWGRSTAGYGGVFSGGQYGISANSSQGIAGRFNNLVVIESDSAIQKPHLRLHETVDGDFARLEFQAAARPAWHIAAGGGANQVNFYNTVNGDVMSLSEAGELSVKVLTILGGADIAEPFKMSQAAIDKGKVVVIDAEHPGKLKESTRAYDKRVAGIVSGAGGVQPGLSLQQKGVVEGELQVALSGRVYVWAEAASGAIQAGDLLTTSEVPGHAMKAADLARAPGATLGKAMSELKEGKGLVLVLVTLQ